MGYDLELIISSLHDGIYLLAIAFVFVAFRFEDTKTLLNKIIVGFILSVLVFLLITSAWTRGDFYFDARSVFLPIAGMSFGLIPTVMITIAAIAARLINGFTIASVIGIIEILYAAFIGLFWGCVVSKKKSNKYFSLLIMAYVVQFFILTIFLITRGDCCSDILHSVYLVHLIIYPAMTLMTGALIQIQKEYARQVVLNQYQRQLTKTSLDAVKDIEFYSVDTRYRYLVANEFHIKQMKKFYNEEVLPGKNFLDMIIYPKMFERIKHNMDEAFKGEAKVIELEVEVVPGKFLEERYSPIFSKNKEVIGVSVLSRDITEYKMREKVFIELAYNDHLTGLYNRRGFTESIEVMDSEKYWPLGILYADINGLKITNDALGHHMGDQLLIFVSEVLKKNVGEIGYLFRIGGDEFAALIPRVDKETLNKLIRNLLIDIQEEAPTDFPVSVSFGKAISNGVLDIDQVIREAENDMYSNKIYERDSFRSESIRTILNTFREKNPREELHSKRVSKICKKIGEELNMSPGDIAKLEVISNLHDIGKIAISEEILNKPGKLNQEEWEQIRKHPEIGYRILSATPEYTQIANDILYHHERYDGKGYPKGLVGEEIPIRSRIIAIADAYDAMTSDRPYRKALTHEEAVEEIFKNKGTQFDPQIADIFLKLFKKSGV